jgi:hypothetical protein
LREIGALDVLLFNDRALRTGVRAEATRSASCCVE